nr:unnamed protein product [Callosobruchus chinensis]
MEVQVEFGAGEEQREQLVDVDGHHLRQQLTTIVDARAAGGQFPGKYMVIPGVKLKFKDDLTVQLAGITICGANETSMGQERLSDISLLSIEAET